MASGRRGLPTASVNQSGGGCPLQSRDHERYPLATVGSGTERHQRRFKAPCGESGARRDTASRHDQPPCLGRGEAPVGQPLCRGLLCRARGAPPKRG